MKSLIYSILIITTLSHSSLAHAEVSLADLSCECDANQDGVCDLRDIFTFRAQASEGVLNIINLAQWRLAIIDRDKICISSVIRTDHDTLTITGTNLDTQEATWSHEPTELSITQAMLSVHHCDEPSITFNQETYRLIQALPGRETCNGLDDDCDQQIDEFADEESTVCVGDTLTFKTACQDTVLDVCQWGCGVPDAQSQSSDDASSLEETTNSQNSSNVEPTCLPCSDDSYDESSVCVGSYLHGVNSCGSREPNGDLCEYGCSNGACSACTDNSYDESSVCVGSYLYGVNSCGSRESNGDFCEYGCSNGECSQPVCGNGRREGEEECDDGNTTSFTNGELETCSQYCTIPVTVDQSDSSVILGGNQFWWYLASRSGFNSNAYRGSLKYTFGAGYGSDAGSYYAIFRTPNHLPEATYQVWISLPTPDSFDPTPESSYMNSWVNCPELTVKVNNGTDSTYTVGGGGGWTRLTSFKSWNGTRVGEVRYNDRAQFKCAVPVDAVTFIPRR